MIVVGVVLVEVDNGPVKKRSVNSSSVLGLAGSCGANSNAGAGAGAGAGGSPDADADADAGTGGAG
jgi:hypothetical protein